MSTTVTTTTTETVRIKPTLRRKLLSELRTYAELKTEYKALEHAMNVHKDTIAAIREEVGATNIDIEGFKVSYVSPTRSTLSKEKLLQQGVTMGQIENATVVTPVKPYVKVSLPGEAEKDYSRGN